MVSQANEIAKDKQKEVDQARKEADEARANLYTTQLAQIQSMQKELIDTIQKVREQGTPEAAMGVIEKYQGMIEKLRPKPSEVPERSLGSSCWGYP